MIRAEELMIGDLLTHEGHIVKVEEIAPFECLVLPVKDNLGDRNKGYRVSVDELEPIPLTVEMLEENGWIHYPAYEDYHNHDVPFRITYPYFRKKYPLRAGGWIALNYVHRLQQVCRLSKVNLEIEVLDTGCLALKYQRRYRNE